MGAWPYLKEAVQKPGSRARCSGWCARRRGRTHKRKPLRLKGRERFGPAGGMTITAAPGRVPQTSRKELAPKWRQAPPCAPQPYHPNQPHTPHALLLPYSCALGTQQCFKRGVGVRGGQDWRPPASLSKNASARDSKLFLLKLSGMHKTYPCSNVYKGHGFSKCAAARASHHEESNPTAHAAGQLVGDSNVEPTCSRFVLRENCDPSGLSPKAASSAPSGDSLRRRPATSTASLGNTRRPRRGYDQGELHALRGP